MQGLSFRESCARIGIHSISHSPTGQPLMWISRSSFANRFAAMLDILVSIELHEFDARPTTSEELKTKRSRDERTKQRTRPSRTRTAQAELRPGPEPRAEPGAKHAQLMASKHKHRRAKLRVDRGRVSSSTMSFSPLRLRVTCAPVSQKGSAGARGEAERRN